MRVRKVAKQLKLFHRKSVWDDLEKEPVFGYKVARHADKVNYIIRMTRKNYFGLARKFPPDSMMGRLCIHKACSPYLYEEVLAFWGYDIYK